MHILIDSCFLSSYKSIIQLAVCKEIIKITLLQIHYKKQQIIVYQRVLIFFFYLFCNVTKNHLDHTYPAFFRSILSVVQLSHASHLFLNVEWWIIMRRLMRLKILSLRIEEESFHRLLEKYSYHRVRTERFYSLVSRGAWRYFWMIDWQSYSILIILTKISTSPARFLIHSNHGYRCNCNHGNVLM